jgi:hypothetical protein
MLHVMTLLALALCGLGCYVGMRGYGTSLHEPRNSAEFIAGIGVLSSLLFGFAVLMEGFPNAVVSPCL